MAKKFLDASGVTYLAAKLADYPNNEILAAVIDGIDEAKQNKVYLLSEATNIANITRANDNSAKGVSPYNTSYYYTNITVDTTKVDLTDDTLTEGTIIGIQLATAVSSTYRNVRIRFGTSGAWIPVYVSNSIMSGSSYLGLGSYRQFIYSTVVNSTGAFHMINDSNSTYSTYSLGIGYGTCATEAATTAKVVTHASYALTVGGINAVKFTYDVPANATLNVNNKGAKAIYYQGAAITSGIINAGDLVTFVYDGSHYQVLASDHMATKTYVDNLVGDIETLLEALR